MQILRFEALHAIAASIANCDLAQMPAALQKNSAKSCAIYSSGDRRYWMWFGYSSGSPADLCGRQLAIPHYQATFKIGCAERSLALY